MDNDIDYTKIQDTVSALANRVNGAQYPGVTRNTTFKDMGIFDEGDTLKLQLAIKAELSTRVPMMLITPSAKVVDCAYYIFLHSI